MRIRLLLPISFTAMALLLSVRAQSPAPAAAAPVADEATLAAGKAVYNTTCFACHQPTGLGLPPAFPPLKDSDWVAAPKPGRLVRIVLHGVTGPLTVSGKPYNGLMPGHAVQLTDDKIAAVLTYIRHEYGNKAAPVSSEYVAAARAAFKDRVAPWTEKELLAVPDK
jgi:mono/diheme cytochrome c family protein